MLRLIWQCFLHNLIYQIILVSLIFFWDDSGALWSTSKLARGQKNFRIWYSRSLSKISEKLQNTWSNRIIGHCETILIYLTKVTKDFKSKHRSCKGEEIHTICYQEWHCKRILSSQQRKPNPVLLQLTFNAI